MGSKTFAVLNPLRLKAVELAAQSNMEIVMVPRFRESAFVYCYWKQSLSRLLGSGQQGRGWLREVVKFDDIKGTIFKVKVSDKNSW